MDERSRNSFLFSPRETCMRSKTWAPGQYLSDGAPASASNGISEKPQLELRVTNATSAVTTKTLGAPWSMGPATNAGVFDCPFASLQRT